MPQRRILHWWFVHRYRRVNSFCPRDDTFLTFAYLARNRFPKKFGDWYKLVAAETLVTWIQMRASRGRSRRGRSPPPHETYKNNFIHDNFLQLEKQHPQHKAILPSIVLSQQCCEAFQAIMRLWLPNIIEIAPPPKLTGWIRPCVQVRIIAKRRKQSPAGWSLESLQQTCLELLIFFPGCFGR